MSGAHIDQSMRAQGVREGGLDEEEEERACGRTVVGRRARAVAAGGRADWQGQTGGRTW